MRWTDLATWMGPITARNAGGMATPPRGLVLHIASGFYAGTISWQKRSSGPDRTSSHFIVGRDGRCAQLVDTADASWAQKSGNGTWLSVELEGFAPDDGLHAQHPGWETATAQQVEVCARLLARAHRDLGVPLQLATSPAGRGLGHHSMGAESGADWGHSLCPGTAIKGQKPAILARAVALAGGALEDDMAGEIADAALRQLDGGNALGDVYRRLLTGRDGHGTSSNDGASAANLTLLAQKLDVLTAKVDALAAQQPTGAGPGEPADAQVLAAAVLAVLRSPEGQAALVQAANTAEDS